MCGSRIIQWTDQISATLIRKLWQKIKIKFRCIQNGIINLDAKKHIIENTVVKVRLWN